MQQLKEKFKMSTPTQNSLSLELIETLKLELAQKFPLAAKYTTSNAADLTFVSGSTFERPEISDAEYWDWNFTYLLILLESVGE
jgi:hypothetical protein